MDAWRWLRVQGGAVKCASHLSATNRDLDQLALLLLSLPALERAFVTLYQRCDSSLADLQAFLAAAGLALACCPRLQRLDLEIEMATNTRFTHLEDESVVHLAVARALERLLSGLAGLPRLRALSLELTGDCTGCRLPACVSRLAHLTWLSLGRFKGLCCARGWARLPALKMLHFTSCQFAGDGEDALPGVDALVSLTRLSVVDCSGLRWFPASLWRLSQLRCLRRSPEYGSELYRVPRSDLPVAGLPATAPSFASFTHLTLMGHNLPAFPPGILSWGASRTLICLTAASRTCPRA